MRICLAAVMNFCVALKLSCAAGETPAHHRCRPTRSNSASLLFGWDSKIAKVGNRAMSALAQIFTRPTASISVAETVDGGASSGEPGVSELRPPAGLDVSASVACGGGKHVQLDTWAFR